MRKITSLTAALSFIVTIVTSVILYIVPQGRVAYWADWRLWGLSKEQWGNVHINVGLLFLLALGLHIYYNWRPLMAYLKNRSRQMRVFTPSFNVALAICLATVFGTLLVAPPFSWVLDLNIAFKDSGARKYGEPPYGHAELSSLRTFAKKVELDTQVAIQRLKDSGFRVTDGNQTLQELAGLNKTTPKALFEAMKAGAPRATEEKRLPGTPPPGTGRLSIAELCTTYGLDPNALVAALKARGIDAAPTDALRTIAENHKMGTVDLYELIKTTTENK